MTAPAYKAASSIITDSGSGKTVPWPTHVAGDYAILIDVQTILPGPGSDGTLTMPAGFTYIGGIDGVAQSLNVHITAWWCVAISSSMTSPTIASNTDVLAASSGQIITFSGAANQAPDAFQTAHGDGFAMSAAGTTSISADDLIAVFATMFIDGGGAGIGTWANANLTGFAGQAAGDVPGGSGLAPWIAAATGSLATPGATGTTTATWTGGSGSYQSWAAITIALAPAAATLVSITVTPNPSSIAVAATQQLAATGHYSDSSTADLTATATWASDSGHASVDAAGLVTGVSAGVANITATSGAINGSSAITVTGAAVPVAGPTPTFAIVAHSAVTGSTPTAPIAIAHTSVGTGITTTTSPPVASQTAGGEGARPVPTADDPHVVDITAVDGTTLDQLQGGSSAIKWVVAIEGYPWLLTDADPDKAALAWTGTDYTKALPGLVVELSNEQKVDPWDAFANKGGKCVLHVQPESTDQFGIDTHRMADGAETTLTATVGRADMPKFGYHQGQTTGKIEAIPVADGTDFVPGDAFIGTECVNIVSCDPTFLWVNARGRYAPFPAAGSETRRYGRYHLVSTDSSGVRSQPVVSQQPRVWVGKYVGVYMHKVNGDGTLNSHANALCVYAGRIVSVADDANTGHAVVELEHVLTGLGDMMILRDQYTATVAEGCFIATGQRFQFADDPSDWKQANDLTVVSSGASGTNQINEGNYQLEEIATFLNAWLAAESAAGRINGQYSWASPATWDQGQRTVCTWWFPSTSSATNVNAEIALPAQVAAFLGLTDGGPGPSGVSSFIDFDPGRGSQANYFAGKFAPWRTAVFHRGGPGQNTVVDLDHECGSFVDQYALLPAAVKSPSPLQSLFTGDLTGKPWGIFLFDEKYLIFGSYQTGLLEDCWMMPIQPPGQQGLNAFFMGGRRADEQNAGPVTVRQVLMLSASFATILKMLFYASGTPGYNHPTYDALGYGIGIGMPGSMLGPQFEASIDALPSAGTDLMLVVDEPTKLSDLMDADLLLRRAFPVWKARNTSDGVNAGLLFSHWQTATSDLAVLALEEANKAEPSGNVANQRSPSVLTTQWVQSIVKIDYNRDLTLGKDGNYQGSISFYDSATIDDVGAVSQKTISARNTFSDYSQTGAGLLQILPGYLAAMPLFSRPIRMITRSIDLRAFEGYAPGDVVLVTDNFSRDPATGERRIFARAGMMTHIKYDPGGPTPGKPGQKRDMMGEVNVVFLDLHRYALYAPCAQVDSTASSDGFSAGWNSLTRTLRCLEREHSEVEHNKGNHIVGGFSFDIAAEPVDAASFKSEDRVIVSQIDPDSPTSYLSWKNVVHSVSGDDIVLRQAMDSWDASKQYRIVYDRYSSCHELQLGHAFQADDTNRLIEDVAPPFEYSATSELGIFTANGTADPAELVPDFSYADGAALDTGHERAIVRTLNALVDYKTAHNSPTFVNATPLFGGGGGPSDFRLYTVIPIFLALDQSTNSIARFLTVAPIFVAADNTEGQVRVTIARDYPKTTPGVAFESNQSVTITGAFSSATWSLTTTDHTSTFIGEDKQLNLMVKDSDGCAYLIIEYKGSALVWGLAKCVEGPRILF